MQSAVSLELTSLIDSDLTWKKISKGKRSTSRRARKPVARSLRASGEVINRKSKRVDMPVSESEKLGVTVLGCHFSGKAEHVPIKKRRFLFRSPSPPPRSTSPCPQETDRLLKSECDLGQGSHPNSMTKCQVVAVAVASANEVGQFVDTNVDVDAKKLVKNDGNEAFSSVSILGAAACGNNLGRDDGFAEVDSGDSTAHESLPAVVSNNESCYFSNGLSKEDVSSAKVSSEGTGSCISKVPAEESIASLREDKSSNSPSHGNIMQGTSLHDNSETVAQDLSSKDDGTVRTHKLSSRDVRLHWDLNTAMDAWDCPFDNQVLNPKTNIADAIFENFVDRKLVDKMEDAEEEYLQRGPGVLEADIEKTLPSMSGEITQETNEASVPEYKLDAFSNIEGTIALPEKLISCEIDSASNKDLVKEIKSLDCQAKFNQNNGPSFSVSVEHVSGPSKSTDGNPSQCAPLGSTGSCGAPSVHQVAGLDSCSDHYLSSKCHLLTRTCMCEENCNATCCGNNSTNMDECNTDTEMGEIMSCNCEFKNQKVALPLEVLPGKSTHEIGDDLIENVGDPGKISCLLDEQNITKNLVCMESSQPLGTGRLDYVVENAAFKSDEMGSPHSADACDANQIAVAGDKNVHQMEASRRDNADTDAQMRIDAGGTTTKCLGESTALSGRPSVIGSHNCDKVAPKELLEQNYDSDIPQNDPSSVGGIQQTHELQVDYDSQYEDGELRESIEHTWEEYDVEDGEAEHVDYGSDDRDAYSFNAADHHVSMSEGAGRKKHRVASTNSSCSEADLSLKNLEESKSRSCPKAFTLSKVIAAQFSKERAVKTCQPCERPQTSAKAAIDESDMSGQVDKELGTGPDKLISAGKDDATDSNQSVDLNVIQIGRDRLPESCKGSLDIVTEVGGCSDRKNRTDDGRDAEDSAAKGFGSRAIKRESQSRVNGLANHGMFFRKDRPQGNRFDADGSESRSVREWSSVGSFRTGRDSQHIYSRSWRGDHRVDFPEGQRGFKRRFSPSYPGPPNFPRRGPDNVASVVSGKVEKDRFVASNGTTEKPVGDGPSDHTWRQTTDPSSHGADGPMKRNGSPADRNRDLGMHLGTRPAGNTSGGSATVGRGRYIRRYGQRFEDRGPRGRYHGPVSDDCIESSSNQLHHLSRRERSFSPIERRRDFHANRPCTKSPSRSRTRSPNGWESPKGRNRTGFAGRPCFKHRSRSPDFRSQRRMPRMRSPHQRDGFSTDQMIGFMSMPRRHDSPQRNTRWIDDREEGVVHFREQGYKQRSSLDRRSPARIFSRNETFGFEDTQQRLKQNDYSRSKHPGRFSRLDGVGRGGPRYEGSDDDRRHGYRYGQVHPLRRRDSDGALKRFHYDNEDGFVAEQHNSRNKGAAEFIGRQSPKDYSEGIDSQIGAVGRRSREERGSFSYRRDEKFSDNSKSFEVGDIDEDVPLKGE